MGWAHPRDAPTLLLPPTPVSFGGQYGGREGFPGNHAASQGGGPGRERPGGTQVRSRCHPGTLPRRGSARLPAASSPVPRSTPERHFWPRSRVPPARSARRCPAAAALPPPPVRRRAPALLGPPLRAAPLGLGRGGRRERSCGRSGEEKGCRPQRCCPALRVLPGKPEEGQVPAGPGAGMIKRSHTTC